MPYPGTYPPLYELALILSITLLKKEGFLEEGVQKQGVVSWSRDGERTASIQVASDMKANWPEVKLKYQANGSEIESIIRLSKQQSNLGKGYYYYFICPHTGRQARKLYCFKKYFLHRTAYNGCMYSIQTRSRKDLIGYRYQKAEEAKERMYERYYRPVYAGRPTRTAKRIEKKLAWRENFWLPAFVGFTEKLLH